MAFLVFYSVGIIRCQKNFVNSFRRIQIQGYLAVFAVIVLIGSVVTRTLILKRRGITAMNFAKTDKSDFLILPFAFFYVYSIFAAAFSLPFISRQQFFHSEIISWIGVFFCLVGAVLLWLSIAAFGDSFRVGIDTELAGKLITNGIFSFTRNPIYVGFGFFIIGQFLVFSNWILLVYITASFWLFHRQVIREEDYLKKHYGKEYFEYYQQVRRYI
jgi:protein-S-isoprenylcysteine O-methyltransferase Ste14